MATVANSSMNPEFSICIFSIPGQSIFTAWFSVYLLFLPVFLFVLYIGFNKWKKPQSSASGGLSHSDVFTLHMVAMEMINVIGSCLGCYGFYSLIGKMLSAAESVYTITYTGQMLFHVLTCVERYLAVVHPVTYLRLRREVTIRNISIALVWVISVVYSLVYSFVNDVLIHGILGFTVTTASIPAVVYCSVYVLIVLTRPKPGEMGGHRKQIDQSKRSTVYTMVGILGALLLRIMVHVIYGIINFKRWCGLNVCVMITVSLWIALPSCLVLPLLFLHRARKLYTVR